MVSSAMGTGRIAIPIARAGVRVIGVDSSPEMLAVARRAAASEGLGSPRPARRRPARATAPSASRLRSALPPSCTWRRRARSSALRAARRLLAPEGSFSSDAFAPSQEDIEETHDRWLEREPGIFERAVWDEGLSHSLPLRPLERRHDDLRVAWPSAPEWHLLLDRVSPKSRRSTAGSTSGRTRVRRTWSSSAAAADRLTLQQPRSSRCW